MSTLNIIGNGFDLYHGMLTNYYYFACYILTVNEELYDDMAEMYGFFKGVLSPESDIIKRKIDNKRYWKEFEKNLGYLSSTWVEDSLVDDLYLESPDAVELQIDRKDQSNAIKEVLQEWVTTVVDTEENYNVIRKEIGEKRLHFGKNDKFISFNYTHILEEIYRRYNVLYIHGDAAKQEELIIGHGNDKFINDLEEKISQLELDEFDQESQNRKTEYKYEKEVLQNLRKPVEKCELKLRNFIEEMEEPEYICTYGFSYGDVDMPYLQMLRKKWPKCKWKFSYYGTEDILRIEEVVSILNIKNSQYEKFLFKNTETEKITNQLKKELENKITLFKKFEDKDK